MASYRNNAYRPARMQATSNNRRRLTPFSRARQARTLARSGGYTTRTRSQHRDRMQQAAGTAANANRALRRDMSAPPSRGIDRAQPFQQRRAAASGMSGGSRYANASRDLSAGRTRRNTQQASQRSGFQGNSARRETPFAGGRR